MKDPLLKAAIDNNYDLKYRKFSQDIYLSLERQMPFGDYSSKIKALFNNLKKFSLNVLSEESSDVDPELEIILEILLSFEHAANSLLILESLLEAPIIFRMLLDNIARYYAYNVSKRKQLDPSNFDKKEFKNFNSLDKLKKIFPDNIISIYHFAGAESHLGSIINKNQPETIKKIRDNYILNIYKEILVWITQVWADIVIKVCISTNDEKALALYEEMTLTCVLMGAKLMELEAQNV